MDELGGPSSPRPKRRRHRRSDFDLPIPKFESKSTLLDFSLLDSPPEKEPLPATFNLVSNASCLQGEARDTIAVAVEDTIPVSSFSRTKKDALNDESNDSDVELLRSSVFCKDDKNEESSGDVSDDLKEVEPLDDLLGNRNECMLHTETSARDKKEGITWAFMSGGDCASGQAFDRGAPNLHHDDGNHARNIVSLDEISKPLLPIAKSASSNDRILMSVDKLYMRADIHSVTVRDIITAIEAEHKTTLNRQTRKLVKARLTDLISSKTVQVAPSTWNCATENVDDMMQAFDDVETVEQQLAAKVASTVMKLGAGPEQAVESRPLHSEISSIDIDKKAQSSQSIVNETPSDCASLKAKVQCEDPLLETSKLLNVSRSENPILESPETIDALKNELIGSGCDSRKAEKKERKSSRRKKVHNSETASAFSPAKSNDSRKRTRKGLCPLCTTCFCSNAPIASEQRPLAKTELEIERALINRQIKLEKIIDKHESDLDLVTRELKRRRRAIIKRRYAQQDESNINGSRFLLDVDVWDLSKDRGTLSSDNVQKSQRKLFGRVKGGQPTLTQILGVDHGKVNDLTPIVEEDQEESISQTVNALEDDDQTMVSHADDCLEEPTEPVERIMWRDGKVTATEKHQQTLWSIISSRIFGSEIQGTSEWDQVFAKSVIPDADDGFDMLLDLFGSESNLDPRLASERPQQPRARGYPQEVTFSQLSQSAQDIVGKLEHNVTNNSKFLSKIEQACPNWKENIRFALRRHSRNDIESAVENVRESREKLNKIKVVFLSAWQRQLAVLKLFETCLSISLQRANHKDVHISSAIDVLADVESDVETVIEFSPLSQDALVRSIPNCTSLSEVTLQDETLGELLN